MGVVQNQVIQGFTWLYLVVTETLGVHPVIIMVYGVFVRYHQSTGECAQPVLLGFDLNDTPNFSRVPRGPNVVSFAQFPHLLVGAISHFYPAVSCETPRAIVDIVVDIGELCCRLDLSRLLCLGFIYQYFLCQGSPRRRHLVKNIISSVRNFVEEGSSEAGYCLVSEIVLDLQGKRSN